MNNKIIIAVIVVAVIALGGYFLFKRSYQSPITQETPPAEQEVVTYSDSGYSPGTLTIKVGATVVFKNESSRSMWTASAIHPIHRAYPTTGGCIGSTFDACQGIQPSGSWSFKFDIAGTWKYHNHLSPGDTGTIVVK